MSIMFVSPGALLSGPHRVANIALLDEKQLINVFLKTRINVGGFSCKDMETVFFPGCKNNIQLLFDQLPGMQFSDQLTNVPPLYKNTNPGFAGLEQSVNGAKGFVRTTEWVLFSKLLTIH